MEIEFV